MKDNIPLVASLFAALCVVAPAAAQLPSPAAGSLGLGGAEVATVRGFGAVAANPAGLAMASRAPSPAPLTLPGKPITLTVLPLRFGTFLGPVTLFDVGEWNGREIPDAVRELWLQEIEADGFEQGGVEAQVTLLALSRGRWGVQLAGLGAAAPRLNPDASELVLFGNAGRTGEPREFRLGGSAIDSWMVSSASLAYAHPLDVRFGSSPGQSFAVGATLSYLMGNVLFLGRDLGSFFSGDPLEVWLRFPVVQTEPRGFGGVGSFGYPLFCLACLGSGAGSGVSLNLGAQWESGRVSAGATVENVVNTFRWDVDELVYRPGSALFNAQDESESDFAPRPARDAPEDVLAPVRAFSFPARIRGGAALRYSEEITLFASLATRLTRAAPATLEPALQGTAALELRRWRRLPLGAHVTAMDGGFEVGGAVTTPIGGVRLSGAGSIGSRDGRTALQWMLVASTGFR